MPEIDIDPSEVTEVREGNALWPGLTAFTGISFLVYLGVEAALGVVPPSGGLIGQLLFSAALAAFGILSLARARYFYVELGTAAGKKRIGGLSKPEQRDIAARYREE